MSSIGVPKEIKVQEHRVALTPDLVRALVSRGHTVVCQSGAGARIGFTDEMYRDAGAKLVQTAEEVWACEIVVKVKEPQPSEVAFLRSDQVLFCYLHLAAEPELANRLVESGCVAIAYETVTNAEGRLPLLIPASEIAGRVAIQVGATALQMNQGGRGVLLGGVPGTPRSKVVVIGAGVSGTEAARMAVGMGAHVVLIDRNLARLRQLDILFNYRVTTLFSTEANIREAITGADLVVGSVLLPGKKAPRLVTREMLSLMPKGAVIVDIAIDQGGCTETSKPTTHDAPTYVVDGIIHYCVTNMPGTCPRTATQALTNATGHYILEIADYGYKVACSRDPGLQAGLNVCQGHVTYAPLAEDLNMPFQAPQELLVP